MTHSDNADDIRRMLTMASHIEAARAARAHEALPPWDSAASRAPDLIAARGRLQEIKAAALANPKAEARFNEALRQHDVALRDAARAARSDAVTRSTEHKDRLRSLATAQAAALAEIAPAAGTSPARFFLNRPILIWPTQGLFFADSAVVPAGSWAKFRVDSELSAGYEEMSFYYIWSNPSPGFAVINVNGYLVLNGYCQSGSDGGFLPRYRYSSLKIHAKMHLHEWWNQPPTQPWPLQDTSRQALWLYTSTGGWSDVGAIEYASIYRGFDLQHTQMLVPPGGAVVFEVAAAVEYGTSQGLIIADFESGDHEVVSPGVLVTVLT